MHTTRTSSDSSGNRRCSLRGALFATCLIAAGWSTSGAAAPSALYQDEPDLAALELATGDYTLDSDEQLPDGRDEPGKAPYLYLTPRVATILENVFGDGSAASASEAVDAVTTDQEDEATSPVVDNLERPLSPQTPSFDSSAILPRFQRQMYRTDI